MRTIVKNMLKIIGWLLILCFVGFSIYDGYIYDTVYKYGSAPFYLYIMVRFINFAIPGILCLIVSRFFKGHKEI